MGYYWSLKYGDGVHSSSCELEEEAKKDALGKGNIVKKWDVQEKPKAFGWECIRKDASTENTSNGVKPLNLLHARSFCML